MIEFINVPITLDAAAGEDSPRTITGVAVPWDTTATVSSGEKVSFKRGAFDLNAKAPKLLEGHDMTQLRGVVTELVEAEEGLLFTAKFAKTRASDEAIELVKAGAYDSVSVGAVPVKYKYDKSGVMVVSQANLVEISLVAQPAFADAVITEIAASEPDADETPTPDIPEEEPMSNENPAVEASAETVPTTPIYAQARPDFKMPSINEYLSKFLQGGSEWATFNSNIRAAAPNVVTSDLDGVVPEIWTQPVYNALRGIRPVIDAIGTKAMPQAGKIFIRPKVVTHTTIGASNGENVALDQGTFVIDDLQVTKGVYGGYVKVSEESIDWSQPEVIGLLLDDMAREYARQTDNVAADNLVTGSTNETNFTVADITDPAEWARWMYTAAEQILVANQYLPTHLFLSANMWRAMAQLVDTADRPLFPQYGPQNAFGNMTPTGSAREAFGFSVVVDANFANDTIIVGVPDGFEIFEQAKGAISAEANDGSLSRTLAFRGYLATLMIDADKFEKAKFV